MKRRAAIYPSSVWRVARITSADLFSRKIVLAAVLIYVIGLVVAFGLLHFQPSLGGRFAAHVMIFLAFILYASIVWIGGTETVQDEYDRGTLEWLLGKGVSYAELVFGKYLGIVGTALGWSVFLGSMGLLLHWSWAGTWPLALAFQLLSLALRAMLWGAFVVSLSFGLGRFPAFVLGLAVYGMASGLGLWEEVVRHGAHPTLIWITKIAYGVLPRFDLIEISNVLSATGSDRWVQGGLLSVYFLTYLAGILCVAVFLAAQRKRSR